MSAFTGVWTWELVLLCVCICLFAESLSTQISIAIDFLLLLKKKKSSEPSWSFGRWISCVCLFFQGKYVLGLTQQCVVENEPNSIKWKFAEIVLTTISEFYLSSLKKKLAVIVTNIARWMLRLLPSGKCCCCSLVSRSVNAALIANSEWNCCITWLLQRVMSSQSVVTLLFRRVAADLGLFVRPLSLPLVVRRYGAIPFQERRRSWRYLTNITTLKWACRERRKSKGPLFFFFFLVKFYFFAETHVNGSTRRQPIRAQGQRNLPLPYHFPEFLYILTQKSEFPPPCSLDRNADASSPTFWERSHYSAG